MRAVLLENELLQIGILADKGSEIFRFLYKPLDVDVLYLREGGVRNPAHDIASIPSSGGMFLDNYSGGWQEILPNGGGPSSYRGAEFGQHGEVSLVPWDVTVVEDSPECVSVRFSVSCRRTPLAIEKTLSLKKGEAVLTIDERVQNHSQERIAFMWGHHPAFGGVMLAPGCKVWTPARKMIAQGELPGLDKRRLRPGGVFDWPHGTSPTGETVDFSVIPETPPEGASEVAYLTEFPEGWYAVVNPERKVGFAMRWDEEVFPYLWFWQELRGSKDYPWWGQVETYALEPWTSYPTEGIQAAIANGTACCLDGGEAIETRLVACAFEGLQTVDNVTAEGRVVGTCVTPF